MNAVHAAAPETVRVALDDVGAALVDARTALLEEPASDRERQDALVLLCRAAYDALYAWQDATAAPEQES